MQMNTSFFQLMENMDHGEVLVLAASLVEVESREEQGVAIRQVQAMVEKSARGLLRKHVHVIPRNAQVTFSDRFEQTSQSQCLCPF